MNGRAALRRVVVALLAAALLVPWSGVVGASAAAQDATPTSGVPVAVAVQRGASPNLTGHWEGAQGAVDLVQRGSSVTGGGPSGVRISGSMKGDAFTFRFWEGSSYGAADGEDRGRGSATYDPTADTLVGSWRTEQSGGKYNGSFVLHRVASITGPADPGAAADPGEPAHTESAPVTATQTAALGTVANTSQYTGALIGALAGASTAILAGAGGGGALPTADPGIQAAQATVDSLLADLNTLAAQSAELRTQLTDAQNWVTNLEVYLRLAQQASDRATAEAQRTAQASQRLTAELTALQDAAAASDDPSFYAARIDDLAGRWTVAWSQHTKAQLDMYATWAQLARKEALMTEAKADVQTASEAFRATAESLIPAVNKLNEATVLLHQLQQGSGSTP